MNEQTGSKTPRICPYVMSQFASQVDCLKAREKWHKEQIDQLETELAAERVDAERYRYLRDQTAVVDGFWIAHGVVGHLTQWTGDAADAAIDAAIKEKK